MQIAVVFHSGYGHTARQAHAVAEGIEQSGHAKALIVDVAQDIPWDELQGSAGMIFGCPTYMGGPSAVFKKFMEESSSRWMKQEWADKVAAGFTTSSSQSGDKLNTLVSLAIFAAQHGMLWVSTGLMPGNNVSTGSVDDINRLGSWIGAMAQANFDQGPDIAPPESDLKTARLLGQRVASTARRFAGP